MTNQMMMEEKMKELLAALQGVLIAVDEDKAGRRNYLKANTGKSYEEHFELARAVGAQ